MTKILIDRSVVEQALDALDCIYSPLHVREINKVGAAMAALRAALEQPVEQEPVAAQHRFRHPQKTMPDWSVWQPCKVAKRPAWEIDSQGYEVEYRALYVNPQLKREPLTKLQIAQIGHSLRLDFSWDEFARAIEAAHGIGGEK